MIDPIVRWWRSHPILAPSVRNAAVLFVASCALLFSAGGGAMPEASAAGAETQARPSAARSDESPRPSFRRSAGVEPRARRRVPLRRSR